MMNLRSLLSVEEEEFKRVSEVDGETILD